MGFPHSSVGKESACNAGVPSSISGSGRSPGEGIGYPLQYSGASLVAQLVKNPRAMQETPVQFLGQDVPLVKRIGYPLQYCWETWVQSLGWEDPLQEGMATHSSILTWRIP